MIVSPHARVLSAVSKFTIGTVVSIGSDLLLGKPQDLVGTAIGTTASGTQIEYAARGLDKGVIALDKAGKALKVNSALNAIKDIKGARALVKEIEKKISSMKKSLAGQAKLLLKIKQVLEKNEIVMRKLIKKLQDNAAKFSAASDTFQKFKKLREQL